MAYKVSERLDATGKTRGYYINLPADGGRRRQLSFPTRDEGLDWAHLATVKGLPHAVATYDAANRQGRRKVDGILTSRRVTVLDLCQEYVDSRAKASTRDSYRRRMSAVGAFEPFRVLGASGVTRDDLEAFARWLDTYVSPHTRRPLAATTQHVTYSFVAQALRRAVDRGTLPVDPTRGVENRPPAPTAQDAQDIAVVINQAQFDRVAGRIGHPESALLFRTMWATGMRFGEATALGPGDVQVEGERAYLVVRRTWTRGDVGSRVLGKDTKGRARRRVSIPVALAKELAGRTAVDVGTDKAPHAARATDRLVLFPHKDLYLADWHRAREAAYAAGDIPEGLRPHDLRHSHVTNLLRAGVPVHVVSRRVGHASTTFTMDRYGHVVPQDEDHVVTLVELGFQAA